MDVRGIGPRTTGRGLGCLIGCLAPVVLTIVVLLCAIPVVGYQVAFGSAELVVYRAPAEPEPGRVYFDGVYQGILGPGFTRFVVPNGSREVAIETSAGRTHTWTLDHATGLDEYLATTDAATCFVEVDVTAALYRTGAVGSTFGTPGICAFEDERIRVIDRFSRFPMEMSGVSAEYSLDDLPDEIESGHHVYVIYPAPCASMESVSGAALLRADLGC